ncbi:cobalt ABC transporter domain-containing protein [Streptococcus pneumoniae]|nr:cobalt ABC transporter domain-containing protein [Streptococcus pneumoniae]
MTNEQKTSSLIPLNLSVVAFCILFMLYYRRFKMLAWMIILAILPSLANYWAVQLHGDASQAVMLGTRAFVTVCIGLVFVSKDKISKKRLIIGVWVATLTILSHLPLGIATLRCKWFGNGHFFHMTEPLTSHLNPIINHRNQRV